MQAVAVFFHDLGSGGVVIEDSETPFADYSGRYGEIYELDAADFPTEGVRVKAYFADRAGELMGLVRQELGCLSELGINVGSGQLELVEVAEEDWADSWKQYYKPVQISERIVIAPTWEKTTLNAAQLLIELDPGMAFGTGTHPTTVLSILALEQVLTGGEQVIDVGAGTGVLSIAAAKLGADSVLAIDLDPVAVASASQNIVLNQVSEQVTVRAGNLLHGETQVVDVIVANILAEVIMQFTDDVQRLLKPGGYFIASGIIESKAGAVKKQIEASGMKIIERKQEKDWVTYIAQKK
jgi:ribosomal protein L11 methyltransferase